MREIPAGYKVTDVGEIPSDWDVKLIGELGKVVRGASPRPAGDPRYFNGSFMPWLTVTALTTLPESCMRVTQTRGYLTREGSEKSRILPADTVIIANSGATLGVAKILKLTCCANDGIAALIEQHAGDKEFLCYYINTQTERLRDVVASGNGQPNLNTKLIRELPTPFPNEGEQRTIVEALSDIGGLIVALDALIAKKQAIKQGMLQQLLTGKTRLSGFSEPWCESPFEELAAPTRERVDPRNVSASTKLIELEHIGARSGRLTGCSTAAGAVSLKTVFRPGDVLFGKLRAYLRKYWLADSEGLCSTEVWALRPKVDAMGSFVRYVVETDRFIEAASGGYGTHMPRSDWGVVSKLPVSVPPRDEQKAISQVLRDADAEIAALYGRIEKAVAVKQGMMQQLLTGRVRLPIEEATA